MASQHSTRPAARQRHIPRLQGQARVRVVRWLIDKAAGRKDMEIHIHYSVLGVILSHSQPVLCSHVLDPHPLPTLSRFTPPHPLSLHSLRVCWCWVACYAPLAVCTKHTTFDFSPPDRISTPSRIRHKLPQCPRRREARCRAAQSKRPRHRTHIMQVASLRG